MDYSLQGNESLKPLARGGDEKAVEELKRRGNTLTPAGALRKVYTKTRRNYDGGRLLSTDVIREAIEDGRRVSVTVNGREWLPPVQEP